MGNFWLVSWSNVFKSWHLIGCQQPQKHLPIIVETAWVTVFNLFKHLNDLQLWWKLFESIYLVPSISWNFFLVDLLVKILHKNWLKVVFWPFLKRNVEMTVLGPFCIKKIAMNHKISSKKFISDLKTAKNSTLKFRNLIRNAKNSIWSAKNSILKAKNSILKAKNSIFRHFTWVDSRSFAPKKKPVVLFLEFDFFWEKFLYTLVNTNCTFTGKCSFHKK